MAIRFRKDRAIALGGLALMSTFCLALLALRLTYAGVTFPYLAWNLFLAWIPCALALVIHDRYKRGTAMPLVPLALAWLVFFPNAPYLVTDLVHLRDDSVTPVWFDALVYAAFAWTGLLLGFVSLYLMHVVVRRIVGAVRSWAFVLCALALGSFGIYLGRFERWNSWDVFVRPTRLLADLWPHAADPLAHPRTLAVLVIWTGFLSVSYVMLYSFLRLGASLEQQRRR